MMTDKILYETELLVALKKIFKRHTVSLDDKVVFPVYAYSQAIKYTNIIQPARAIVRAPIEKGFGFDSRTDTQLCSYVINSERLWSLLCFWFP